MTQRAEGSTWQDCFGRDTMSLSRATSLYGDAARLYRLGDLHHARDAAEEALLSLSPCTHIAIRSSSNYDHDDVSHEGAPDSVSADFEGSQAQQRQRYRLFGNTLLLLSSIYMAVQDYAEAERLLVTCDGYWRERLTGSQTKATSAGTSGEAECVCCSELDEGLAGVAYNRAVLRLEQLQSTPSSLTKFGESAPWVAPLVDVCGADAHLTNSSLSSLPTTASSGTLEAVLAGVMALLLEAQDRLAHTLGPPRRLLADVLHTIGVCHYEVADHIAALQAWQRSMAIRVHLHALRLRSNKSAAQHTVCRGECSRESGDSTEELKLALTMEHVAQVYRLLEGRSVEALKLLDTVTDTRRRYLGSADPLYVRTLVLKGVLATELGHTKLARALFERCSTIYGDTGREMRPPRSSPCTLRQVEQWRLYLRSTSPSSCSSRPLSSKQRQESAPEGCVGRGGAAVMEVGQRCRLRLADCTSPGATHGLDGAHSDGFAVTGVIVGVRPHAEEPSRRLYYVHCTHIELGAELARHRRKAAAASWSRAPLGAIGSGTMHSCNELRATGGSFVSSEGYHYRYDGWYDVSALTPLCAQADANSTAAVASAQSLSHEPPETVPGPSNDGGASSTSSVSLLPRQHCEVLEEWVVTMERDTAVCEVVYLCYAFQPWFPAPYAALQYVALPEDDVCHSVYVCHRCLSPFFTREQFYVHLAGEYCRLRTPPGRLIYHDEDAGYKAFLVDGAKDLHYCRCLSLLGKQLIESKLLSNDVDLYEYVVATMPRAALPYIPAALPPRTCAEQLLAGTPLALSREGFHRAARDFDAEDWDGDVVIGYFSRLKHHPDHTLSCIVTLPMFQQTRVATFLLDVAYWMTRQRQRVCGCGFCGTSGGAISRPFSPHGQLLLLSYWRRALLRSLAVVAPSRRHASRGAHPNLRFTLGELRALLDIPIHTDDLVTLLLQSEFTFYHPIAAAAAAARDGDDDEIASPQTSSISVKRKPHQEHSSAHTSLKHSPASSSTKATSYSTGGSTCSGDSSTSGARYTGALVLEAALLESAAEFHPKAPHSCVTFDKLWLVKDDRGVYAYDMPCYHY